MASYHCLYCYPIRHSDLVHVYGELHELMKDQFEILGFQLGLCASTLNKIGASGGVYGLQMLEAWLNHADNVVDISGPPTWHSLIQALQKPKLM